MGLDCSLNIQKYIELHLWPNKAMGVRVLRLKLTWKL